MQFTASNVRRAEWASASLAHSVTVFMVKAVRFIRADSGRPSSAVCPAATNDNPLNHEHN